jgi:hypothetical protein
MAWVTPSGAKQPFEVLEESTVQGFAVAGQSRNDFKSPRERCVLSEWYYASFALDTGSSLCRQIRIIRIASYRGADDVHAGDHGWCSTKRGFAFDREIGATKQ